MVEMGNFPTEMSGVRRGIQGGTVVFAVAAGAFAAAATASAAPRAANIDPHVQVEVVSVIGEAVGALGATGAIADLAGPEQASAACLIDSGGAGPADVLGCMAPFATLDPAIVSGLVRAMPMGKLVATLAAARTPHDPATPHGSTVKSDPVTPQESVVTPEPAAPARPRSRPTPKSTDDSTENKPPSTTRPSSTTYVAPTSGTITSAFGDGRGHQGIDIAGDIGAPIVAVAAGKVISAGPAQGFGLWVRIRHNDGTITTYGHNNDNRVVVGQRVSAGEQIATIGNRGISTGPHLHFEVTERDGTTVDPMPWLEQRGASITEPAEQDS